MLLKSFPLRLSYSIMNLDSVSNKSSSLGASKCAITCLNLFAISPGGFYSKNSNDSIRYGRHSIGAAEIERNFGCTTLLILNPIFP